MENETPVRTLNEELNRIQLELKAPKKRYNDFGKYKYRSTEDVLTAVKPILNGLSLLLIDEVVCVGDKNYVKSTAQLSNGTETVCAVGFAREAETKKGMDSAQITGSTSSYARKYALNGLFCIDDAKELDGSSEKTKAPRKPELKPEMEIWQDAVTALAQGAVTMAAIKKKYKLTKANQTKLEQDAEL